MNLEQAVELARRFHAGQTDKAGLPYIGHILRVVDVVSGADEKLAAAMHDLLEDTVLEAVDLRCAGVPPRILDAVEALTRRPGEAYETFIRRAAQDAIAYRVKIADLADNANESRLAMLPPDEAGRLRSKYASALALLESLAPLEETVRAAQEAALTGIPVGARELGLPRGSEEVWSTFWCSQLGCGRPAGTLTLIADPTMPASGARRYSLLLTTFVVSLGHNVSSDDRDAVIRDLQFADAAPLWKRDPELVPFWCGTCGLIYCSAHWEQTTIMDDGFFDHIVGTCPRRHTRVLSD